MLCSQLNVLLLQSSPQIKIVEWYYRYILILWGSGSMPLLLPSLPPNWSVVILYHAWMPAWQNSSFSINYYHFYVRTVIPIHINLHVQDYPKLCKLHIEHPPRLFPVQSRVDIKTRPQNFFVRLATPSNHASGLFPEFFSGFAWSGRDR